MPVVSINPVLRKLGRSEQGFTMIVTLGVLLVSGLLLVAAFTAAQGDIGLSHQDSTEKQAYYAALAGIQQYEYQMQANPNYWQSCAEPEETIAQEPAEHYEVKPLPASDAASLGITTCMTTKPFESMIERTGAEANTFRIESTGYAGTSKHSVVATFQVTGFLNYVYFTNFETMDPGLYNAPSGCAGKYYSERPTNRYGEPACSTIQFTSGDEINGPMHTNDAADVCGTATFGRAGHEPPDVVEMNGGTYSVGSCYGKPTYYNSTYKTSKEGPTKGNRLEPPAEDTSLKRYVEPANEFTGLTHLVLNGSENTIEVTSAAEKRTISWPANGLIYVKSSGCKYSTFELEKADTTVEEEALTGCGTVYVSGTYSQSLTIGSEDDVIIDGDTYPTSVAGKLGAAPTGTAALGLIANNYVRIYHPIERTCEEVYNWWWRRWEESCSGQKNGSKSLYNPWVYAAILATKHSFVVDNYNQGSELGNLNVYGAIAQDYRGVVGTTAGTGYIKNYVYDERLAVDEPPYFLSPLNAGWKVARETSANAG